jgi:vitamin B12 transporter
MHFNFNYFCKKNETMPTGTLNRKTNLYFKKWSRKNFSVFASLGKQICISVLTATYTILSLSGVAQGVDTAVNRNSIDTLPEVEITAGDDEITEILLQILPIVSLNSSDIHLRLNSPKSLPGVEIRLRGGDVVQGDLQIRGGTAEQAVVSLNKVPLNDAQTAHHNLNIPIPEISVTSTKFYPVAGSIWYFDNVYSGAVDFETKFDTINYIKFIVNTGSYGLKNLQAGVGLKTGKIIHALAYAYGSSNGYKFNTDYTIHKVFYSLRALLFENADLVFQSGISDKSFGAQSFYSNKYPYQYEEIKTGFISLQSDFGNKHVLSPSLVWRRNHDRFELFRESLYVYDNGFYIWDSDTAKYIPNNYEEWNYYSGHNYHLTDNFRAGIKLKSPFLNGLLLMRINLNSDRIYSTVLGNETGHLKNDMYENGIVFTHFALRNQLSFFSGYSFNPVSKLQIKTGLTASYYNEKIVPGGSMQLYYKLFSELTTGLAISKTGRIPSFTELYYKSATNIGNADLQAEELLNYELIFDYTSKGITIQNRLFLMDGINTIDWVRYPNESIYKAMNHTQVITYGNTFFAAVFPQQIGMPFVENISVNYTILNKQKYSDDLISAYALDYLKNNFSLSIKLSVLQKISSVIKFSYYDRNGTYTYDNLEIAYPDYSNTDITFSYSFKRFDLNFSVYNLFGVEQFDFGGINLPDRSFNIGLNFTQIY